MIKQKNKKNFYFFTIKNIIFIFLALITLIFIVLFIQKNNFININSKAFYNGCPSNTNQRSCVINGCKWIQKIKKCVNTSIYNTFITGVHNTQQNINNRPCSDFNENKKQCERKPGCYYSKKYKLCLNK